MKKFNCTRDEAVAIASTIHDYDFTPEEVDEVLFVVQRKCPNCGQPHITTVSGTTPSTNAAVHILTNALLRVIEEGTFDV